MPTEENRAFAERLKLALTRSPKPIESAAELAVQFNLRHSGAPVTQQAVHKWLTGKSRPTADKIETLAAWLRVSAHWLRYGLPEDAALAAATRPQLAEPASSRYPLAGSDVDESRLLQAIRRLRPHQRWLIQELVNQMLLESDNRHSG